ncbi:MAG: S41 family peptidase [Bacteroidia bacterium]
MKKITARGRKWLLGLAITGAAVGSLSFVDEYFEISKNLDIFAGIYKEVHTYYVDDIEPGKLMRTGIDAMLESLDPYTSYYSEAETEDYRFQITGQYGGIGAVISIKGDYVIINEPYEGSPAQKADLRPGDELLEADGKSLKGMRTDEVSKLLKGSPNTPVKVKIRRHGVEMVKELVREQIHVKNVPYYGMINSNTGYIRLSGFTSGAGDEVKNALIELKKNASLEGVVLDLRGNPGGLLHEAINVVNVFIERDQLVVSTKGKVSDLNREYKTLNNPVDLVILLVVLANGRSASASEIVSGTIQDLDRGVVLGQRTFGKGLVQSTRPLKYGTQLKLTTQKYYTPSGRCIQALDYSNRNEDGSVGSVPDSLKKAFKTKNGRTVYDGGGIEPDVAMEAEEYSNIAISLLRKNLIFDYAVEFRGQHETISSARDFKMTEEDWNGFLEFIKDKDYAYQTETERELSEMAAKAKKEGYFEALESNYTSMLEALNHDKKADVLKNRAEIQKLLEEEIARHYYYQSGRFEIGFTHDKEIMEAVEILKDPAKLKKTLSK